MTKIYLLFFLLLIVVGISSAQTWKVGAKAGVSIPKLRASETEDAFSSGYKTKTGVQAGLLGEYQLTSLFSLQTELNYSKQGGVKDGQQSINTASFSSLIPSGVVLPDYLYATFNGKVDLTYLEFPLLAKFNFRTSTYTLLAIYAGPYLGYLVKAEGVSSGKSKIYTDPAQTKELTFMINGTPIPVGEQDLARTEDIIDQCNRVNYGVQGGMSFAYQFPTFEIFVAAGGTYGLRFVQEDPNFGQNKTGGATISLGACIRL